MCVTDDSCSSQSTTEKSSSGSRLGFRQMDQIMSRKDKFTYCKSSLSLLTSFFQNLSFFLSTSQNCLMRTSLRVIAGASFPWLQMSDWEWVCVSQLGATSLVGTFNITDNATIHSTFISTSHLECEPTLIYHDDEEGTKRFHGKTAQQNGKLWGNTLEYSNKYYNWKRRLGKWYSNNTLQLFTTIIGR